MRVQITFSLNLETGSADITPGSKKKMEELTTDGLMAMDLFGDIAGMTGLVEFFNVNQRAGVAMHRQMTYDLPTAGGLTVE